MSNRKDIILISAFVIGALGFVGYQIFRASAIRKYPSNTTFTERARLTEFVTNGVRVVVFIESDSQGRPLLRATFMPTEQGFHLYSKELDPKTVGGIGMPTILQLLPNSSVKAVGPAFADVSPLQHEFKELNTTISIYPDGPVTLRLPIQFDGPGPDISAQVAISFMACKTDGVCLLPVERQVLNVQIPRSQLPPNTAAANAARRSGLIEKLQIVLCCSCRVVDI